MHALITGASSGIGAATCRKLSAEGASLTLIARREQRLEEVATECGPDQCFVRSHDLTDVDGLESVVEESRAELGPIDVLVNNAGVSLVGPWNETDWQSTRKLMTVNLLAPLRLIELVSSEMCERGRGTIVNVSSVAALAHPPYMSRYTSSKSGLASASESLAAELGEHGVDVVTVYPGPVRTSLADTMESGFDSAVPEYLPWGETDVLAERIVRAVRNGSSRVIYPRFYYLCRWFPLVTRFVMAVATRRMDVTTQVHD